MVIFTDGACTGNGSKNAKGGFGVLVLDDADGSLIDCYQEFHTPTTNNRMELSAILWAFLKYGSKDMNNIPVIYSDSAYCINTYTIWMWTWERNGWIKSDNQIPLNLDLIQAYHKYWQMGYRIELRKVKGHSGIKENEMVDGLATGKLSINEVKKIYG